MNRPDFSQFVAHFTKASRPHTALDIVIKILKEKRIVASTMPWTNKKAACFTECPFYSMLAHKKQYSAYGIGFKKEKVFAARGGPAIYLRHSLHSAQNENFSLISDGTDTIRGFHKDVYAFVTPFHPSYAPPSSTRVCDYSHEREWRTPNDFVFSIRNIVFIAVQSYADVEKIKSEVKISEDKILIFDVIEKIEELWPTHII